MPKSKVSGKNGKNDLDLHLTDDEPQTFRIYINSSVSTDVAMTT
jgi:hypothetical protein